MSTSQICYFPEGTTRQKTEANVLPLQRKVTKEEKVIHYFPDIDETGLGANTATATEGLAKQELTRRIQKSLMFDESYMAAIATIDASKSDTKKKEALLKKVIAATVKATIAEVQATPEKFQLEHPKSPWLPGYLKQLAAPLIEPEPAPKTSSFEQERQVKFKKIGELLKRTREKRGFTHSKLNHMTHILTAHIIAIEAGELEKLPEALYVKGFIRRLGTALGLNGEAIAATFPMPKQTESRYKGTKKVEDNWTTEAGRYVGYTALMMGAVSGLSWSLNQSQQPVTPAQPLAPPPANQATDEIAPQIVQTDAKISPPEMMQMP
ncbi:helix-turn-helix domain-containing protein [[Limnothrix rosea] IAM M-220]|uniref:helix-turn-helix domain-containing protein n=1 Tax=[Limnothrix rosea] IAM M-220 TaxID=454133 RepID=UPI000968E89E|nr:helix-turn-helix transcriptional regulator [[Limnothrix rosea] IAM M-220]OKH11240.1 hypothetical protein NIES208_17575 [[Limnothrix rosea] IAM M-220]